ncbi:hypothetical protein [Kribbella sp. NPDC051770]|uniref:hypothetical protein n=1 Tax=Kribbella sp. NPDC051770 TaxID=3155413 RepID=UPI00341B8167
MEERQGEEPEVKASDEPRAGVMRQLFDTNTLYYWGPGWVRWFVLRFVLLVIGTEVGAVLWRVVVDSDGERSFFERMLTNVYIWACLIATLIYAIVDRRARRREEQWRYQA